MVAVAHYQASEGGNAGVDLGLESFGEHAAGTFADEFVDQRGGDGAVGRTTGAETTVSIECAFPADIGVSAMCVSPQTIEREGIPFPVAPQVSNIAL